MVPGQVRTHMSELRTAAVVGVQHRSILHSHRLSARVTLWLLCMACTPLRVPFQYVALIIRS